MRKRTSLIFSFVISFSLLSIALFVAACGGDDPPNGGGDASVVVSTSGAIVKGEMGQTTPITFAARDNSGNNIGSTPLSFVIVSGDGSLSATSDTTDNSGFATVSYSFDGVRGDAIVRAILSGKDTALVVLRANTLIPGSGGQAEYILLTDRFRDIIDIDGQPVSIDIFPGVSGQENTAYLNYEQAKGFVPVVYREATENTPRDTAHITTLIVNTIYDGKTADSIGVGASYHQDILPAWGQPDTLYPDPDFPTDVIVWYASLGTIFYATSADTTVFEIHLLEPPQPTAGGQMAMPAMVPAWSRAKGRESRQ